MRLLKESGFIVQSEETSSTFRKKVNFRHFTTKKKVTTRSHPLLQHIQSVCFLNGIVWTKNIFVSQDSTKPIGYGHKFSGIQPIYW